MKGTPLGPMDAYRAEVEGCRGAFFRELSELPVSVSALLSSCYQERLDRRPEKPLLGEYAPWLLADLLNVPEAHETAKRIAPAWMNLYAYTLFIDDALDRPSSSKNSELIVSSSLLLERGITSLCAAVPNATVLKLVDQYFCEAAQAVILELQRHRQADIEFKAIEIRELGNKVALLKLCGSCLFACAGIDESKYPSLAPVSDLATGMQILDDITDWEEDWRAGQCSLLLLHAMSHLGVDRERVHQLSREAILRGLVTSGALAGFLQQAIGYLKRVQKHDGLIIGSPGALLLESVIEESGSLLAYVLDLQTCSPSAPSRQMSILDSQLKIFAQQT